MTSYSRRLPPLDTLVAFEAAERKWPDWRSFLAMFRVKEPPPIEGLVFSSYHMCLDVAEAGEGVALGWGRSVQPRLTEGRLVRIGGMTMPLKNGICVYRPKGKPQQQAAEQFLALLRRKIEPLRLTF